MQMSQGESPTLLLPIVKGRENPIIPLFPPLKNHESQLTTGTGLFSGGVKFDNNHGYSGDDGDNDFHTTSGTLNEDNYTTSDTGINYYSVNELT
jgi:hypothetical protein